MAPPGRAPRATSALAALLVALVVATVVGTAIPGDARGTLEWSRCGGRFECARLDVPVHYDTPNGEQVSVAVIRAPARDHDRRIGTLVVNFGGPGDAGAETLPRAIGSIPREIRDRFDIVSFDPRGTGGTRAIDCIDDDTTDALLAEDPTPDDDAELERFYSGDHTAVDVDGACIARHGSWLAALGTRNVARDVDRIRVALGETRLNFLGYSYGTVLGAVYAQEFPDRIRSMVLDSAVNLSATTAQEQSENATGFEHALGEFLAWCGQTRSCDFGSGEPTAALMQLRDRFEAGLTLPVVDGRRVGVGAFYLAMLAALYDRANGWPSLALGLRSAERGDGTVLQVLTDLFLGRDDDGRYNALQEAIGPIRCADRRAELVSFADFRTAFETLGRSAPFFGPLVGSSQPGCDPRLPAAQADEVLGDVRATPTAQVLIVGTTADPATPYAGALDLSDRITGSRVLTYVAAEHAAYGRGVACIDAAVNRYLVTKRLPAAGKRCAP